LNIPVAIKNISDFSPSVCPTLDTFPDLKWWEIS